MKINFSTRYKARQFAAKRKAGGFPAKIIDNASKAYCVVAGKRFSVCLKGAIA